MKLIRLWPFGYRQHRLVYVFLRKCSNLIFSVSSNGLPSICHLTLQSLQFLEDGSWYITVFAESSSVLDCFVECYKSCMTDSGKWLPAKFPFTRILPWQVGKVFEWNIKKKRNQEKKLWQKVNRNLIYINSHFLVWQISGYWAERFWKWARDSIAPMQVKEESLFFACAYNHTLIFPVGSFNSIQTNPFHEQFFFVVFFPNSIWLFQCVFETSQSWEWQVQSIKP